MPAKYHAVYLDAFGVLSITPCAYETAEQFERDNKNIGDLVTLITPANFELIVWLLGVSRRGKNDD